MTFTNKGRNVFYFSTRNIYINLKCERKSRSPQTEQNKDHSKVHPETHVAFENVHVREAKRGKTEHNNEGRVNT